MAAADLEHDTKAKKRVLRKGTTLVSKFGPGTGNLHIQLALEHIPNSVRLWKETVNLETSAADARILLARAVEVIPQSVELWLALARLETPDRAKAVLNKARGAVPTSHEIWIAACRLMEQEAHSGEKTEDVRNQELQRVDKTVEAAVKALRKNQVLLTREQWIGEAEKCEVDGSLRTCEGIIKATIAMDIEEEDRLDTWRSDAETAEQRGKVGTARAILAYALRVFPDRTGLWLHAASLERTHGTRDTLIAILERAVQHCPHEENLWLMWAKEKWLAGDVPAARNVLEQAFGANPESEKIWLAAVKLEAENGELEVARELLNRARTVANTERVRPMRRTFSSPLIVRFSDLDEVCSVRTPARTAIDSSRDSRGRAKEVPQVLETLHDTRADLPVSKKLPCCARVLCCRDQGRSQESHHVDTGKQIGGGRWQEHQIPCTARQGSSGEPRDCATVGGGCWRRGAKRRCCSREGRSCKR